MRDRIQRLFLQDEHWRSAEIYLLVVLIVFGVSACFLLPLSGGYDEETHLLRVWEMSANTFIPNDELGGQLPFPAVYWELSYRRQFLVRAVEPDFWGKYGRLSIDAHDYIYGNVETRSVYSPPLLLPQALVMRFLGRRQQLPALSVYYSIRLIGLFSYLLLAWLAVRLIPFGKWILAILASSPVAILQASTISADAISNGIALLFIGGTIAIARRDELRWKDWASLVFLFFLLFWGKINIVPLAILPFLMIRPSQFKIRHGYVVLLAAAMLLCLVEVLGWNLLAYSRLHTAPEGTDPAGQIRYILTQPVEFISLLANDVWSKSFSYMVDWIAIYGYAYWPVPIWTYYLYGAGLLAALLIQDGEIERRTRFGLLITFAVSYLATIASLYITFNPVRNNFIGGVQGRYFITVMPLLFLALAGLPFQKRIHVPASLPVILGVLSLVAYTAGMYLSYHVLCGSQYYRKGLCYQPNYKNWAPDELYSPPISSQLTLAQEIVPECSGVAELRVWVNAHGADPDATTEFILKDVNVGREITSLRIPNSDLPAGDWFTLRFTPDWESNGKFYLLTMRGNGQSDSGPRIAYSLRPEYPAGKLYENDLPVNKDVIFQTGCIAGLDKFRLTGAP